MFIWDFVLGDIMDQVIDWVYAQLVGFFGNFFSQMGNMGVELFEMSWVQSHRPLFFLSGLGALCRGTGSSRIRVRY